MNIKDPTWQAHAEAVWKAQIYIQENLGEALNLEKIARAAQMSVFDFHRIFRAFTGESLNQYVQRLRLEKAAGTLRYTQRPVTDIALETGFETPSSFSRAFHRVMGRSPHRYRSERFMQQDNETVNKGETMQDPTIEELPSQPVLFVRRIGPYDQTPAAAWEVLMTFAKEHPKLFQARKFSLGLDDPNITADERLRFDACVAAPEEKIEKGEVGRQTLSGGKYAVFIHKGSYENLEQSFDHIFHQWYPDYKDEVEDRPCFCEHLNMELLESHPDQLQTKIYVPLKS